jgi:glycerol-3-phosphate acyltransferase PlsY
MAIAVLLVVLGFFAGSVPFGVLFARARGIDLRRVGSGNIGATNAARALGKRAGVLVFVCDAAKGGLPIVLARQVLAGAPWSPEAVESVVAAVGGAAFLGHLFSPWLGFRGGKGVATAFGVFLTISPAAALGAIALFLGVYAVWRLSSLGSLAAATAFLPLLMALGAPPPHRVLAAFMWLLIVWRHRGNIARLLRGEEKKV